jgi:hypothetical protein
VRLFEAADGLRKPTAQCERVLAHVTAMAGHVAEIGRVGESLPGLTGEGISTALAFFRRQSARDPCADCEPSGDRRAA